MISRMLFALTLTGGLATSLVAADNQVYELRTYTLVDQAAEAKLDAHLESALVPALERQGLGPIGAFDQANAAPDAPIEVMLLIAGPDTDAVTGAAAKLADDAAYQRAAADYLATPFDKPLLRRIRSELLLAFDCWPTAEVPQQKAAGRDRLFELRTYESPTERTGDLKVEMFNSGEVPIFLASGVAPVFMGRTMVGERMPNLTYLTVYDDATARDAAWKKFSSHPEWLKLRVVKKYEGTVSTIHKSDWTPKPYSRL
ncbi:hypothetical protein Pla108_13560 [Botrimarina colliarenosi]|uniref:NIPSNAP domain-containing protein n=1 Tax=Botrimarina colliarenosi TaxID=2528001 RepID=A0A5C6AK31_9BACT|nr:NIPSNAP family protein [Botrimarina colliarenosi]TWU00405.1 hypothetical protein Pla108_13560 [Botrimarina colliarenosi]